MIAKRGKRSKQVKQRKSTNYSQEDEPLKKKIQRRILTAKNKCCGGCSTSLTLCSFAGIFLLLCLIVVLIVVPIGTVDDPSTESNLLIIVVREHAWVNNSGRVDGGIADRFAGISSHFMAAVAANSRFCIDWPDLDRWYKSPTNMTCRDTENRVNETLLLLPQLKQFSFRSGRLQTALDLVNSLKSQPVTVARGGHGILHRLWDPKSALMLTEEYNTTHLRDFVNAIPFRSAFGTIFNQLFQPTPDLLRVAEQIAPNILNVTNNNTKVLIQIRTGDGNIGKANEADPASFGRRFQSYFDCASQIVNHTDIAWFLMTDSEDVKKYALEKYGSHLEANVKGKVSRSHYRQYNETNDPLKSVLAEQWIGTQCDVFVVTKDSGLGRQAAFRAMSTTQNGIYHGDSCEFVSWDAAAWHWSEI